MRTLYSLAVLVSTTILSACGGSSDNDNTTTDLWQVSTDKSSTASLTQTNAPTLTQYMKFGLYAQTTSVGEENPTPTQPADSGTNLITPGVDEADRVKFSDRILYVSGKDADTGNPYLKRWFREADSGLTAMAALPLADPLKRIKGLYVDEGQLTVLGDDQQDYIGLLTTPAESVNSRTVVQLFEQGNAVYQLELDGALLDSRRTDDALWLVSRYRPHAAGLLGYAATEADKRHNMAVLQAASLAELLPKRRVNNAEAEPMFSADQCYLPADIQNNEGSSNMVVITRLSTSAPYQTQSACVVGEITDFYMSAQHLYLHGLVLEQTGAQTVVHKFSLEDSAAGYQATGAVDGQIAASQTDFMLYEKDQTLLLFNSVSGEEGPMHRLWVLQQEGDTLNTVAQLPNQQYPNEVIGKPGEAIYGVRFTGDRAYVVTFERTDPLYTFDISNTLQPRVIGALEIPGYSAYLHSVTDDLLWGLGQNITFDEQGEPVWNSASAKIALFDVSADDAVLQDDLLFSGQYSPLEYQHHSLAALHQSGTTRMAVPLSRFDDELGEMVSLLLLEVADNGVMQKVGELIPEYNQRANSWEARTVLVEDDIYFVLGDTVYHSVWQQPDQIAAQY